MILIIWMIPTHDAARIADLRARDEEEDSDEDDTAVDDDDNKRTLVFFFLESLVSVFSFLRWSSPSQRTRTSDGLGYFDRRE